MAKEAVKRPPIDQEKGICEPDIEGKAKTQDMQGTPKTQLQN